MTTTATRNTTRQQLTAGRPTNAYARVDAWRLATAIDYSGMSRADLARKARVGKSTIVGLTSGARTTCKVETAKRIAKALRKPPAELFTVHRIDVNA